MYRWHFDNSEVEAIVYAESEKDARGKINVLFPVPEMGFKLIGVEEMLSLEDKIG